MLGHHINDSWNVFAGLGRILQSMFGLMAVTISSTFSIILALINIAAYWKIFEKAGLAGWKSLIPFYNTYCVYRISFGSDKGWMFFLTIIPGVSIVIEIIKNVKLAQNFGYGIAFAIGLSIFSPVFNMILAFGDAQYIGETLY